MTSSALRQLLTYSEVHRRKIAWASLCSVINKIFDIMPEILIGAAIDVVVNQKASFLARMGIESTLNQLWVLAAATLIIWMLESLFEYLFMVLWRSIAQELQHELRTDAYAHVQNLDVAYFEDQSTGALVSVLNDDINQLERFLDNGANSIIQVVTTVVLVGGFFFFTSPLIATFAMLPIPVIVFGAFYYQKRIEPMYGAVREKAGLLSSRLANNLSGIATIKSYTAESHELLRLKRESLQYREANSAAIRLSSAFIPVIRMAILFGFVVTLLLGGWLVDQKRLAVGSYSVLVYLTQRLLWPLTGLAQTVDLYQRAMASAKRIFKLMKTPIQISFEGKAFEPATVRGALEFQDVTFCYATRKEPSLQSLSFKIPPGKTWAFVGSTGAGKSTLAKLILRFYDPTQGRILLDGDDLKSRSLRDLRRSIGFISQDVFLFPGTVRENIAYGRLGASLPATHEAIVAAAKAAEAHEFIEKLPEGYDTVIGERGQKLSGGQRQRLSIARAVLKNPPLLILDEATSAVDNETEAAIQSSLEKIAIGRTTLVIAHRLSTIRNAHQIAVLEQGRLIEAGTHESLLERQGAYAGFWRVQTGERSS